MARGKGGGGPAPKKGANDARKNGKAFKKYPKMFDHSKGRLVTKKA